METLLPQEYIKLLSPQLKDDIKNRIKTYTNTVIVVGAVVGVVASSIFGNLIALAAVCCYGYFTFKEPKKS